MLSFGDDSVGSNDAEVRYTNVLQISFLEAWFSVFVLMTLYPLSLERKAGTPTSPACDRNLRCFHQRQPQQTDAGG